MSEESKDMHLGGASDQPESVIESGINEKTLLRKLDARLLPAVGILYLLSFLDRSNGKSRYPSIVLNISANNL